MKHRVFVYGLLQRGQGGISLEHQTGAKFLAATTTSSDNYTMMDLGSFPAVCSSGTNFIRGELWEVTPEVLEFMDHVEGHPDFYQRESVHTKLGSAWIYQIKPEALEGYPVIQPLPSEPACWRTHKEITYDTSQPERVPKFRRASHQP